MRAALRLRRLVPACVVSTAVLAGVAAAAPAAGDHWYRSKGSSCIARAGQSGAWARASVLMHADDFPSTKVQAFKLSARLVPTTAGLDVTRPWKTFTQRLTLTGTHDLVMTVYAPVPDTLKDWNLQIRVTWDRMSRLDWHNQLTVKNFSTATCPGAISLPATAQAEAGAA
jgi:hypothetical protein